MSIKKQSDFKFKVVAGRLKGKVITAPNTGITRPPLTRLRRAIFDFLAPYLSSACYLDLFSGTGSYLFEAVSRGAGVALGVEVDPKLAETINRNAGRLEVSDQLTCLAEDVFEAVRRLAAGTRKYDIVMVAPPQYQGLIDRTLVLLKDTNIVSTGGLIICQHDTSETAKIDFAGFEIEQHRKYGNTTFTILRISDLTG
ncbi:MAG: 16S rRNA (guanine(966)-N(2))-methyltransferase RsmD [bacterium]